MFSFVDIFLLVNFETLFNKLMFQVFLSTNESEAREFMQQYLQDSWKVIFAFMVFALWSAIFIIKIPKISLIKSKVLSKIFAIILHPKVLLWLFIVCVGVFCFLFGKYWEGNAGPKKAYFAEKNIFFRFGLEIKNALREQNKWLKQYDDLSQKMKSLKEQKLGYITHNNAKIPKVVLIIGESTQRNYMSLYGYPLRTSPHLESLRDSGNLVVFNDVVSPHSRTDLVLQKVLTYSNYENFDTTPWYEQQNLINIMRFAGYKSIWLSNQEAFSIWENAPVFLSRHADITQFSKFSDYFGSGKKYDGVLLSMLDSAIVKNKSDKAFYILHLMGTHGYYKYRFPKDFAKFSTKDLEHKNLHTLSLYPNGSSTLLTDSQKQLRVDYINAVYYNDFVVSEIMRRFKDDDAIVFYLSDHADEVYDFRDFAGHTENIGSRFMIEVPFVVYMSDKFKQNHKDLATKIQKAQNLPFMSDDFIHAFFDIIGVKTKDSVDSRSIFNQNYNKYRKRIFAQNDYDKELKSKNLSAKVPQKLWLHRVDEIAKLRDFWGKYSGYEIDVHFLENNPQRNTPYFDVGHDGLEHSINLSLGEMFDEVNKLQKNEKSKNANRGGAAA